MTQRRTDIEIADDAVAKIEEHIRHFLCHCETRKALSRKTILDAIHEALAQEGVSAIARPETDDVVG